MKLAFTVNSHSQMKRAGRDIQPLSGGLSVSLGSKTRFMYCEDTQANREKLVRLKFKIHKKRTSWINSL